jgi:hypothetical protein
LTKSAFRKSFRRRDKYPYGNRFQQGLADVAEIARY